MRWNCLSVPKLQRCKCNPTLHDGYDHLSLLGLKLIRISKKVIIATSIFYRHWLVTFYKHSRYCVTKVNVVYIHGYFNNHKYAVTGRCLCHVVDYVTLAWHRLLHRVLRKQIPHPMQNLLVPLPFSTSEDFVYLFQIQRLVKPSSTWNMHEWLLPLETIILVHSFNFKGGLKLKKIHRTLPNWRVCIFSR